VARTISNLAAYFDARAGVGELRMADSRLAASQFMMACQASLFLPYVFQSAPAPTPERIAQVVDSATQMFLAAYRTKAG